jgi:hypothetical protein
MRCSLPPSGRPRPHGQGGAAQAERAQHPFLDLLGVVAAGDGLHDHPGEHVARVAVRPVGAREERRRVPQRDAHQVAGGPVVEAVVGEPAAQVAGAERRIGGEVVHAAGVVEELAHGHPAAVVAVAADDAGQVGGDRVVQVEPPLRLQLEQYGGDEGLGDAADPEPVLRQPGPSGTAVGDAGRALPRSAGTLGTGEHAGHPCPFDQGLHRVPGGGVPVVGGRGGVHGDHHHGGGGQYDGGGGAQSHRRRR